jgi:hypothetical protein
MQSSSHQKILHVNSEGQEMGAITPAPENARKKLEGRGRARIKKYFFCCK